MQDIGVKAPLEREAPLKELTPLVGKLSRTPTLQNCRFSEMMLMANQLHLAGFKRWWLCPGMQFNSLHKWWGDHGQRDFPHEGIDICLFEDINGQIKRLDETGRVPAIANGVVKAIFTDYLGQAVILAHERVNNANQQLLSVYAHTAPLPHITVGSAVKQGEILATLADTRTSKAKIIPHLHFSLALASPAVSYEDFVWNVMRRPDRVILLDPVQFIQIPFRLGPTDHAYCLAL